MISVIVPVYNAEPYLCKCLESILNQTYNDLEIIVIDDGSTDCSGSICDEYAKLDRRIAVIHTDNRGVSNARNLGLKNANGDYVAFIDSDDYIENNMYEKLISVMNKNQLDIVISAYFEEDSNGNAKISGNNIVPPNTIIDKADMRDAAIAIGKQSFFWFVWRCVYRRAFLRDIGISFYENVVGEDTLFNIDAFLNADRILFVDNPLYHYVCNPNSIMRSRHKENYVELINNNFLLRCRILEKHSLNNYSSAISDYALNHLTLMLLGNELYYPRKMRDKIKAYKEIRNSDVVSFGFNNSRLLVNSSKQYMLMLLLKQRMYLFLAIIDKLTTKISK